MHLSSNPSQTTARSLPAEPNPYAGFPAGFFDRSDSSSDAIFYEAPRLVTHIDAGAISAVGQAYVELGVNGRVLDLMSSWISHLQTKPAALTVLGMNAEELAANPMADEAVVHDLNKNPMLPFDDDMFDQVVCTVSVDYLARPIEVFREVARVLAPGGVFVCTFSNRCFPTKAIRGWLSLDDVGHCDLVEQYFRRSGGWEPARSTEVVRRGLGVDPLFAVWAHTLTSSASNSPSA